jgi:hypothetical protein
MRTVAVIVLSVVAAGATLSLVAYIGTAWVVSGRVIEQSARVPRVVYKGGPWPAERRN